MALFRSDRSIVFFQGAARGLLAIAVLLLVAGSAHAESANDEADTDAAVTPGELIVEPPTLINLGFRWMIEGDAHRRAEVRVQYREEGEEEWREGLPMLRIGGEVTDRPGVLPEAWVAPDMFGGSILDLEPGTTYECRFEMSSPDGVRGDAVRTVTVSTRPEPKASEDGRVFHVYPPDYEGEREEPAFDGLKQAFQAGGGDWSWAGERRLQPGDTILVHPGVYKSQHDQYADPHRLPFHGTYFMPQKGTAEEPIVIRGTGEGEAVFDGAGAYMLFDVTGAEHIHFQNLTFRNADIVFWAGVKHVAGADGLVVRNCRFEDVGIGVKAQYQGSEDFYIADNVFLGRKNPNRLNWWASESIYGPAPLKSYYAVKVYGSGHVICHNYVAYFHDGITVCTHTVPDDDLDRQARSIDIYNNDIHLMSDDFIEGDGGVSNIRIMRNRGFNAGQFGFSGQPIYGGPAYYIRNIGYHSPNGGAFKFQVRPSGLLVYHNTLIASARLGAHSNAHFRNNLFLDADVPGRPIVRTNSLTHYTSWDYNGYRLNPESDTQFQWRAPAEPGGERSRQNFDSLEALQSATGQETHGLRIDYDIFEDVTAPDAANPYRVYHAEDFNFQLRQGAAAIDAGKRLPNVNDEHTGEAPDLGALERDRPEPTYGPRTQPVVGTPGQTDE